MLSIKGGMKNGDTFLLKEKQNVILSLSKMIIPAREKRKIGQNLTG